MQEVRHQMTIPAEPPAPSLVASGMFQLASVAQMAPTAATSARPAAAQGQTPARSAPKRIKLAPISEDVRKSDLRAEERRKAADPASYKLAPVSTNVAAVKRRHEQTKPPSELQVFYWNQMRKVYGLLHNANDYSQLLSILLFLLLLVAILLHQRNLAVIGATAIVLLNIGRLVISTIYLITVPFKDNPLQGILFLIPPFTFYYLAKHWNRLKRAAWQFVGPVAAIAALVVVFAFVPWLGGGNVPQNAPLTERIKGEAEALQGEIKGQVERGVEALDGVRQK